MKSALIGSTGFVGSTLLSQREFDFCYHSTDIADIDNKEFDLVICAAAPAKNGTQIFTPMMIEHA